MEMRRLGLIPARTTLPPGNPLPETEPSLLWRCRASWYDLRCGRSALFESVEGLPDFVVIPSLAGGDEQGNLREMLCDLLLLRPLLPHHKNRLVIYQSDLERRRHKLGRLSVYLYPGKTAADTFVSLQPETHLPVPLIHACHRFATTFAIALKLEQSFH